MESLAGITILLCFSKESKLWSRRHRELEPKILRNLRFCSYFFILYLLLYRIMDSGYKVLQISCMIPPPHTHSPKVRHILLPKIVCYLFTFSFTFSSASHHLGQDFGLPGQLPVMPPKTLDCFPFEGPEYFSETWD